MLMKKTITILLAAFAIMSCGNTTHQAQSLKDMPWQEIAPTEIELNPIQMIDNDYFTVTHFPADMRGQLSYLGRVSGRDEDKVAGAGLTVEFTELGNPIYAEADLAIECKKLYGQQFDASLMPAEQREWYEKSGLGIHYMYIGEIIHVWKK